MADNDSTNAYPCGIALAASFDTNLLYRLGVQMSKEAYAKRVHVVLGPTVNIVRSPLAGRGFEFFSEDPYLSGKLAARYVQGIQDKGVAACMKHFVSERSLPSILLVDTNLRYATNKNMRNTRLAQMSRPGPCARSILSLSVSRSATPLRRHSCESSLLL